MEYIGYKNILKNKKTAFLCSQKCPADIVLKSYDWAKKQREAGNCVVCGNHSQIEKDVFEILLKGKQSLILVLARGMKTRLQPDVENAVNDNRLLIVSPFNKEIKRVTRETAAKRNENIIEISDGVTVGYKTENGLLDKLLIGKDYEKL